MKTIGMVINYPNKAAAQDIYVCETITDNGGFFVMQGVAILVNDVVEKHDELWIQKSTVLAMTVDLD